MTASRRDWYDIAALLLVLVALFLATSCASATPTPTRTLPPPEVWPACLTFCESQGFPYIGIILPAPDGKQFGCGCGPRPQPMRDPT
jgi:hypothetical protein